MARSERVEMTMKIRVGGKREMEKGKRMSCMLLVCEMFRNMRVGESEGVSGRRDTERVKE